MARNLDEPGANFNQLLELSIKLENARTFSGKDIPPWERENYIDPADDVIDEEATIKVADASTEMEQYPDTYLRPGETLEDWTGHYFRKPNAAGGRIYGKYAQQLASGGRVGYGEGDIVLKAKPYNAETFKEKSDLYLQAILGTSDKDFYRSKLQNEYKKAMKEGALSAKEAMEWVQKRAKLYSTLIDESKRQERTLGQEIRGIGGFSLPTTYGVEPDINKYFKDKKAMGGRVGLAEGDTPSQAWMRDYFYSSGLDDKGEISVFEFINGPLGWKAYMEYGPGKS
tara:strand:- start:164 stop:1015 length:852 start_codon:yes stop_codon:yes gene_type:complete